MQGHAGSTTWPKTDATSAGTSVKGNQTRPSPVARGQSSRRALPEAPPRAPIFTPPPPPDQGENGTAGARSRLDCKHIRRHRRKISDEIRNPAHQLPKPFVSSHQMGQFGSRPGSPLEVWSFLTLEPPSPDCAMPPPCLAFDRSGSCHLSNMISKSIILRMCQSRPRPSLTPLAPPGGPSRATHGSCRSH